MKNKIALEVGMLPGEARATMAGQAAGTNAVSPPPLRDLPPQYLVVLLLCLMAIISSPSHAATNELTALLQQGLFEEQANRNLDAAITDYATLAAQFDKDRQLAATAVFRLGECYRAQGRTNEAAGQYQKILSDFSDQATLATLSRQDLAGMGMAKTEVAAAVPTLGNSDAQLFKRLKSVPPDELEKILPTLVPDATLELLLTKRSTVQTQRAELVVDYAPSNVNVMRVDALLTELNKQIGDRIAGIMAGLKVRAELPSSQATATTEPPVSWNPVNSGEDQEIWRIQQMLQNSPDLINAAGEGSSTPLVNAAYKGWLKVAAYLMDHGADVNVNTPLNTAAWAGNRAMVELLLSRGAEVNSKDSQGKTPLHTAVEKNYPSVVEVLLANKADVNAQDQFGDTPLTLAAGRGQVKIVQMLLAAGGNTELETKAGRTALSLAAGSGSMETVKLLLAAKADPSGGKLDAPLLTAIQTKDCPSLELLLQAGADPNAKSEDDWQPSSLGPYGRSVGHGYETPLSLAVNTGQFAMVQLLLKYKADPNDPQTSGSPLLFDALTDTNILESLLEAGANIEAHDNNFSINGDHPNWAPLAAAVWGRNVAAVEILLKHRADPKARDALGNTALHWAVSYLSDQLTEQNVKIVELVLGHGADPNVRNNSSFTPLDWVKQRLGQNGSPTDKANGGKIADLLRQHGALDDLPDWSRIAVSRPAAGFSAPVFERGTNDWNHFTLLELVYRICGRYSGETRFPDLSHVVIVRPGVNGATAKRMEVNLLSETNTLDYARDLDLEFGDVVEVPERGHTLAEQDAWLNDQFTKLVQHFREQAGEVQLVVAGGKTVQVPLDKLVPVDAYIGAVLRSLPAQNALTSSSDLTKVKVTRRDPQTQKTSEWTLDCSQINDWGNFHYNCPDLLLRDGDLVEVPLRQ